MPTLISERGGTQISGTAAADVLAGDLIISDLIPVGVLDAAVGSAAGTTDGVSLQSVQFDLDGRVARNAQLQVSVGSGGTGHDAVAAGIGGSANTLAAFSDTLNGAAGGDQLTGDLLGRVGKSIQLVVAVGNQGRPGTYDEPGGAGGSDNTAVVFADTIDGGTGGDVLVGDARQMVAGTWAVTLEVNVGRGGGTDPGSDNDVTAFGDRLAAGDGSDIVVGDVMAATGGPVTLMLNASCAGYVRGGPAPAGDGNQVTAFNDVLSGDAGNDRLVGDVRSDGGAVSLSFGTGQSGDGCYGGGGREGGSTNVVSACNDTLSAGAGLDALVGDVRSERSTASVVLHAEAGSAQSYSAYAGTGAGDGNQARVFDDILSGGDGNNRLAGDVHLLGGASDVLFSASAGTGAAFGWRGTGGDDNQVVFAGDRLGGGAGDDWLIGDLLNGAGSVGLRFDFSAGADGAYAEQSTGGTRNTLIAANDTLQGDAGDDILVGDAWFVSGSTLTSLDIAVAGKTGNTVSAFRDTLDGGAGNDALWGDFFDGTAGVPAGKLQLAGSFGGRAQLFADTLTGGTGADTLAGGIGSDRLTGGADADRFVWSDGDLTRLGSGMPLDVVTDFRASGDDVLDFANLLASQGFHADTDAVADWLKLRAAGTATIVSIDADGRGGQSGFVDVVRLDGFTTASDMHTLVEDGLILIG